jgi:undecaprenyl-diphosphatase
VRLDIFHKPGVRIALVCYSLLALLAIMVAAESPVAGLDAIAADWAHQVLAGSSESTWLWITTLAGGATVTAVMGAVSLMLWRSGNLNLVLVQWSGFFLARLVTEALKVGLARARPPMSDMERVLAGATNYSFPSGHATSAIYVYGFLILLMMRSSLPRPGVWACRLVLSVVIAAVAVSRIVLGVHFASDVVGGLLSGSAALAIASTGMPSHPTER